MDLGSANTPAGTMPPTLERRRGLLGDPMQRERALNVMLPLVAMIGVLVLWAAAVKIFEIPDYLLPAPQDVVGAWCATGMCSPGTPPTLCNRC